VTPLNKPLGGKTWELIVLMTLGAAAIGAWVFLTRASGLPTAEQAKTSSISRGPQGMFTLAAAHWAALAIEPVTKQVFRDERMTEGKIAVDEDRATLVFSPYSGRVMRLLGKAGDTVTRGQLLFTVEATDMVQAQNDFVAGIAARNKARSQL